MGQGTRDMGCLKHRSHVTKRMLQINFKKIFSAALILIFIAGQLIIFFTPQKAKASLGTRTKTVEWFVGQNFSTTGIASGTLATYDFTVYLPDAITSASVIRSAYIEYNTVISALDSSATAFQLGVQDQTLTTLSSPAIIDQTGESQPVQMKLDATAKLQSIIQAAGTFNLRFTTSITGPVRYGENARLLITYDYNDAAATQVKTVYAWVHSQAATVASGGTVTSAIFNLGLPESTITSQSAWVETRGYVNAALTTGFKWNAETQRNIAWPNTTNSYGYVALVSPTSTYSPNTNNTFTITSVTGAFSAPSAILGYTYSFDYSASTELMNSLKILLYQGTETASTATLSGNKVINIPESGITMKSSFLQGRAVNTNTVAMTLGMNAQLGSTPTTTGIDFLANAGETDGFRTIVWDVTSNLSTMAAGDNTVYWAYSASAATNIRGLTLYLNYKYNKASSTTFNSQAEFFVGQQTTASTTWSQAFTPSIADSNYTLKSSHLNAQFNTNATTATTYTVGIGTTAAYAFLTTGENTMGEVWRDTSSDVTGLGSSLTATLNGSNNTTKSTSFLVWWQIANNPPNAPSNLGPAQYIDGGETTDNTPTFTFDLSDPDSGQQVKYRIQIANNSAFSPLTVDYTSALAAQGSFSFTVGQAAGGGSYAVGSSGQTLGNDNYFWRVMCIDAMNAQSSYTNAGVAGTIDFKVVPSSVTLSLQTYDYLGNPTAGTVNFGDLDPETTPSVTIRDALGACAVETTVTANVTWTYTVQASDNLKDIGANIIPIGNLQWATDNYSVNPWVLFQTTTYTISSGNAPTPSTGTSYDYDYKLTIDWTIAPSTGYSTTITYTALSAI